MAAEADGAATRGMGGAGGANPLDGGVLRRAPAAMVLTSTYRSQLDVGLGEGVRAGGAIWDTSTAAVGLGFAYTRQWITREPGMDQMPGWIAPEEEALIDQRGENALRGVIGVGLMPAVVTGDPRFDSVRRLGLAAGFVYERDGSDLVGVDQTFDMDVSLAGRPLLSMVVAGTARDLLPSGARLPSGELGVWWQPVPKLGFGVDGLWDPNLPSAWGARAGAEYFIAGSFPVRLGYALNERDQVVVDTDQVAQQVGVGVGAHTPQVGIDYGMTLHVAGARQWKTEHSVGVVLNF